MDKTPIQQAIHDAELKLKEMKGQNWRTPIEIAIQSAHVNDLKALLPKEKEFVEKVFQAGADWATEVLDSYVRRPKEPDIDQFINQLYPEK